MANKKTTIQKTTVGSTSSFALKWNLMKPTSGSYIDVSHMAATDRVILIAAYTSTNCTDQYFYVGSSSTADSATTKLLFSAGSLGPMKVLLSSGTDTSFGADSEFAGSGDWSFCVLGPFETARIADTDGHINIGSWTSGSSVARIAAILV